MERYSAPCKQGETDDLKKSSSSGSSRMQKGAVNVAGNWTGTCKSRTASTVRDEA